MSEGSDFASLSFLLSPNLAEGLAPVAAFDTASGPRSPASSLPPSLFLYGSLSLAPVFTQEVCQGLC